MNDLLLAGFIVLAVVVLWKFQDIFMFGGGINSYSCQRKHRKEWEYKGSGHDMSFYYCPICKKERIW